MNEIVTAKQFEQALTFQSPIPITWAVQQYLFLITTIESLQMENIKLFKRLKGEEISAAQLISALSSLEKKFESQKARLVEAEELILMGMHSIAINLVTIESQKEEIERVRQAAKHWQDRYDGTSDQIESLQKENEQLLADLGDIGSGWYGEKAARRAKLSLSPIQEGEK